MQGLKAEAEAEGATRRFPRQTVISLGERQHFLEGNSDKSKENTPFDSNGPSHSHLEWLNLLYFELCLLPDAGVEVDTHRPVYNSSQ